MAMVPSAPYRVWESEPRIILPQPANFSRIYWWITARWGGTKMPPYFLAADRPNRWSSSLIVPPTAHRLLWQLVST